MSGEEKYTNYMLFATGDSVPNACAAINNSEDFRNDKVEEFKIFTAPPQTPYSIKMVWIVARMKRLVKNATTA